MTTEMTRTAAIAHANRMIAESREQVAAYAAPVGAFVVCREDGAVMCLTVTEEGELRFHATNRPRAWNAATARGHAQRWNRAHGKDHPVRVMSAGDWKAARALELDDSARLIAESEAGNA